MSNIPNDKSTMESRFDEKDSNKWDLPVSTEVLNDIKQFIQSEISRAVVGERERIEGNMRLYGYYEHYEKMNREIAQNEATLKSLITKQS